jgi:hypothetical protein
MRLLGLALLLVAAASPALAEPADSSVTVLRGSSAPPPAPPQVVVQTTVVVPDIVYLPAYYPAYAFYYPNFFVQPRRFANQPLATTGLMHQRR